MSDVNRVGVSGHYMAREETKTGTNKTLQLGEPATQGQDRNWARS